MANGDNVIAGYEAAVEMINSQPVDSWSRFNAMLVSNSVLLVAIGLLLSEKLRLPIHRFFPTVVALVLGTLLCTFWALLIRRGDRYSRYWAAVARELEQQLPQVDIF